MLHASKGTKTTNISSLTDEMHNVYNRNWRSTISSIFEEIVFPDPIEISEIQYSKFDFE